MHHHTSAIHNLVIFGTSFEGRAHRADIVLSVKTLVITVLLDAACVLYIAGWWAVVFCPVRCKGARRHGSTIPSAIATHRACSTMCIYKIDLPVLRLSGMLGINGAYGNKDG